MRLTAPTVAKLTLPAGKSEMIVFDEALPGFGVRVRAGGKRVWIAQYRVGAKQRRLTIGSIEKVTADQARTHAKSVLAKVQLGADPQSEKLEARARAAVTLGAVADRYLEGPAKARLREKSLTDVTRHLRTYWKPLRGTEMHRITRADVANQLATIAAENGPFSSNRARASLSALFGWAMREGLVEANPVIGTNKATAEVSRDRVLSDYELALVWHQAGPGDYGRIVRLLILTGQRREEVAGMRWSELDLKKANWSLPKTRTKNGLPHDVPLSAAAVEILTGVAKREKRDLIFGEGEGPFSGWSRSKLALDKRIDAAIKETVEKAEALGVNSVPKLVAAWRLHDLRRTAATRMHDLGVLPHVVEAVLNHVSGHRAGVAGVYNRATYAVEKRAAMAVWAQHLNMAFEDMA